MLILGLCNKLIKIQEITVQPFLPAKIRRSANSDGYGLKFKCSTTNPRLPRLSTAKQLGCI